MCVCGYELVPLYEAVAFSGSHGSSLGMNT